MVMIQLLVIKVLNGPLRACGNDASNELSGGDPSPVAIPTLDFTRATLAQRSKPIALRLCAW
jgi:hypothetical protein